MASIVRCLLTVVSVVTRQLGFLSIYLFMLIQNSLARTVFNTPKTCHITPLLASLHWLKIKEGIEYKLLSRTYNIFTARCYASAVYAVMQCLSVRPSVRLSRSWIVNSLSIHTTFSMGKQIFEQNKTKQTFPRGNKNVVKIAIFGLTH